MADELAFGGPAVIKRGDPKSMRVQRVQEWLNLHKINLKVDRDFGPATEDCVKEFQRKNGIPVTGAVDDGTFDALVEPMLRARAPIPPAGQTLGQLAVAYGKQHAAQHPLEVGKPNGGPWVRLYMDGNDGPPWLWCAGFATYPIKLAAAALGKPMPVLRNFGVANIANKAKQNHNFLGLPAAADRSRIKPGSLFLERGGMNGYMHCGIVVSVHGDIMHTIEGNSNDDGSNNGFEALERTRGFRKMDFALV